MIPVPKCEKPRLGTTTLQASVAQLAELLICNQAVAGSSPAAGSKIMACAMCKHEKNTPDLVRNRPGDQSPCLLTENETWTGR
jgi:hypothetical protein